VPKGHSDARTPAEMYEQLRADILGGVYTPGTALREAAVAVRFGVSRTPTREVLSRLLHEGLLERGTRGMQVPSLSMETVIQVYDLRILLEGEAASQAAENRRAADLIELQRLLRRDRDLKDPDDLTRIKSNLEFHAAVWAAAHNAVLRDVLDRLAVHLVRAPRSTLSVGHRWEESLDEHAALLEAISDRRADEARAILGRHMQTARRIRMELLADIEA
jgi:DNA-binding GntR family transcriptional regulator